MTIKMKTWRRFGLCCFLLGSAGLWAYGASAGCEYDVSIADFPRQAGETDDGARLQRAVNATGHGGVLYLPKGEYESSRTIWVTNGTSFLLHKSAVVRATAKMEHLFHLDMRQTGSWVWGGKVKDGHPYDQGVFFRGGHLDGNGLASCLYLNYYFHFTLRDTVFVNGFPYGLHVGRKGAEIIADNLYFRTIKSGLAGNIALFSEGNDSFYSNIVVVDYTTGLKTLGGANAFNHYHVWGGPVPPPAPGRLPEMLENSVCFDLGGHMNTLRDSYADTGAIGFKVGGWGQQIVGCWYLNNSRFGLKDITIVKQEPGSIDLLIADCCFRGSGAGTKLYDGSGAVKWRDMTYRNIPSETDLPGEILTGRNCDCPTADEWEYMDAPQAFASEPGEFARPKSVRSLTIAIPCKFVNLKFPKAGPGEAVVIRIRATDEVTKEVELAFSQTNERAWGCRVALTPEWREIRLPFSKLKYFKHWGLPDHNPGERPDARKINQARFTLGNWILGNAVDKAHGFEVSSIRFVGR